MSQVQLVYVHVAYIHINMLVTILMTTPQTGTISTG
jgi:hypothetical protein